MKSRCVGKKHQFPLVLDFIGLHTETDCFQPHPARPILWGRLILNRVFCAAMAAQNTRNNLNPRSQRLLPFQTANPSGSGGRGGGTKQFDYLSNERSQADNRSLTRQHVPSLAGCGAQRAGSAAGGAEPFEIVLNSQNWFGFFFRQNDDLGGNFRHAAHRGGY